MQDLLGALAVTLLGALICASGYLNYRSAKRRARGSRRWARANADVTKAWSQDTSGAAGDMTYHVNYTFTAPETGGSYYGHSEHGPQGVETGDDIEVMYDPKAPYNNELPMARVALSFLPIAFGGLTIFGAILALGSLAAAVVIIVDLTS
ncbi:DUF3592 domain-containing protein [Nocardioides albus]|uniref:DUF3592 domain-containing protein n=1 Tax=Nocardioides albus TaxID=1841 RepID=A0A7W5F7H8_9ACTN|nr:DUF3592 domain-containing protein [Nocardioides albus]MBB3088180.1 hypothetical protein [Nocardioides albus]GGU23029.1 hypothetical protein GCM10007979_22470 [Nocardioides albus]